MRPENPRAARLVDDLIAYVNREDVDPVTQAAIAHAQFEIIHPFADGNGRVGRVLMAQILEVASLAGRRRLPPGRYRSLPTRRPGPGAPVAGTTPVCSTEKDAGPERG